MNPFDSVGGQPATVNPFDSAPSGGGATLNPFDQTTQPTTNPFDSAPPTQNPFEQSSSGSKSSAVNPLTVRKLHSKQFNPFEGKGPSSNPFDSVNP